MKNWYWLRLFFPSWEFFSNVPFQISIWAKNDDLWSAIPKKKKKMNLQNLFWNAETNFEYGFQTLNQRLFLEYMDHCEKTMPIKAAVPVAQLQKRIAEIEIMPSWVLLNIYCQRIGGIKKLKWIIKTEVDEFELEFQLDPDADTDLSANRGQNL
jgi:hypothetical protein